MGTNTMNHEKEIGKRLPFKKDLKPGEEQNITELTAIAPISQRMYPEDKLRREVLIQEQLLKKEVPPLWLSQKVQGGDRDITWFERLKHQRDQPIMSYLDHLKTVLDWAHLSRQSDIKRMATIHYARWVILDKDNFPGINGPYLLFTSNYDGKLEEYLQGFSTVDEGPLNLIFSHCIGWPGARPIDGFIKYVKEHQIESRLFYANYPRTTVHEVNRALDWKRKTENFIRTVLPTLKGAATEEWEKAVSDYMNNLAMPTGTALPLKKETTSEPQQYLNIPGLMLKILRREVSVAEATRQHRLSATEMESWQKQFLRVVDNHLRRHPKKKALNRAQVKKIKQKIGDLAMEISLLQEEIKP